MIFFVLALFACKPKCDIARLEKELAIPSLTTEKIDTEIALSCGDAGQNLIDFVDGKQQNPTLREIWNTTCPNTKENDTSFSARETIIDQCLKVTDPQKRFEFLYAKGSLYTSFMYDHWLTDKVSPSVKEMIFSTIVGPSWIPFPEKENNIAVFTGQSLSQPIKKTMLSEEKSFSDGVVVFSNTLLSDIPFEKEIQLVGLNTKREPVIKKISPTIIDGRILPNGLVFWFQENEMYIYDNNIRIASEMDECNATLCFSDKESRATTIATYIKKSQLQDRKKVSIGFGKGSTIQDITPLWNALSPNTQVFMSPQGSRPSPYSLQFSEYIQNNLTMVSKSTYISQEVSQFFSKMRTAGDQYCKMLYKDSPYSKKEASRFVSNHFLKHSKKRCTLCLESLQSGCRNFFQMNDYKPHIDFQLIRHLLPKNTLDCYSVGFLQPIMMHSEIKCDTLTMIDFDWRIHDAHNLMLELYERNSFEKAENLNETLSNILIGWVANYNYKSTSKKAELHDLCRKRSSKACINYLLDFQKGFSKLRHIQLNVSALHDTTYLNTDADRVYFFSNASEPHYTNNAQFLQLTQRMSDSLHKNRAAYLIHHVGGRQNFGIYKLEKKNNKRGFSISTICRDKYLQTGFRNPDDKDWTAPPYDIYLDKVTTTKRPTSCQYLVSKMRKAQKK